MRKVLMSMACLLTIAYLMTSCQNNLEDKYIIESSFAEDADDYFFELDSISIPIESNLSTVYFTSATYNNNYSEYLFGYNPNGSSIDIFDLSKKIFFTKLDLSGAKFMFKFDKQDLDQSRTITDINVVNFDSILINYGNHKLLIVDSAFNQKKVIALDSLSMKNNFLGRTISYSHNFRMIFNNGRLILNQAYPETNWMDTLPLGVSLDLATDKMTFIPFSYSDYLYHIKGHAGFLTSIETSNYQKKGVLTYSYRYESNIYQYNSKDSTITTFGVAPSSGKLLADSISSDNNDKELLTKWSIHDIENTQFFNVMYDKYRCLYYRFSLRNIKYENGVYFNSLLDKPLVLMVFNEKFEVVKEIELPLHLYQPNTWFVTKAGLFISPTNKKNPFKDLKHLRFHVIKIKKR